VFFFFSDRSIFLSKLHLTIKKGKREKNQEQKRGQNF